MPHALYDGGETSGTGMNHPGIIERAFQLAANLTTVEEVRKALKSEGYSNVDAHLAGPSIRADLKRNFAH